MRFRIVILSLLMSLLSVTPGARRIYAASGFEYALIKEAAVLYSDSAVTKPVTSLPATYFVIVLGENEEAFRVSYLDIDGYVPKDNLERVDYEPKYKYASPSFRVDNDGQSANIRSAPDHTKSNIVASLPPGSEGIYYGTVRGTALIPEVGDLWYYVRYSSQPYRYGYVYRSQVSVSHIEANTIERVESEPVRQDTPDDGISYIIVAALTVPALIIMLFVFKKPSSSPRTKRNE